LVGEVVGTGVTAAGVGDVVGASVGEAVLRLNSIRTFSPTSPASFPVWKKYTEKSPVQVLSVASQSSSDERFSGERVNSTLSTEFAGTTPL
jgi:hypothetical protein